MASRMENIAGLFSDVKTRTILVFVGVIFLTVTLVGLLGLARGPQKDTAASSIPKAPSIQATPGITETTPEVAKVQQALNEQRYQIALKEGKSAIPVDIGDTHASLSSESGGFFFGEDKHKDERDKAQQTKDSSGSVGASAHTSTTTSVKTDPSRADVLAAQAAQKQLQQDNEKLARQQQKDMNSKFQTMQTQLQSVLTAWGGGKTGVPDQQYEERTMTQEELDQNKAGKTDDQVKAAVPIIKAGDIMYAVLNTAVNSDEPSPVLATLVTGPYKGTKLVGSIQEAKQVTGIRPKALILAFNSMNIPDQPKSVSVNAVAIDPDTARTALASNVDSHKAERYGALFTSSFMQGYGNAITQAGSTTFNNSDGSQTQVLQQLSPQQEIFAGLGEVGNRWGQELSESFKRPNTITIDPGLSVGILFMADVAIE